MIKPIKILAILSAVFGVLFTAIVLTVSLVSCSGGTEYSLEESLQGGKDMMQITADTPREYSVDIVLGSREYVLSGYSSGDKALFSLKVIQNGLVSNYKDLLFAQGGHLYVNMNVALNIAETESDFVFSEPMELQNKYLELRDGASMLQKLSNAVREQVFSDAVPARDHAEQGRGPYKHNVTYPHEQSLDFATKLAGKTNDAAKPLAELIDGFGRSLAGDSFTSYDKAMAYLSDCIDIDTEQQIGEYELLGGRIAKRLSDGANTLAAAMEPDDAYLTEGVTYTDSPRKTFEHRVSVYGSGNTALGSITVSISDLEGDAPEIKQEMRTLQPDAFLPIFLTNVMNAKGVGYETNDFPYTVTYTATQLTASEKNDLYRANYTFEFSGKRIASYTVTYYTYETYIHAALKNKCEAMNMELIEDATEELLAGTGSGYLQYKTSSVGARYSAATSPVELFAVIQEIGLPSYG